MTMTDRINDNSRPSLDQAIEAARAGQRDDAVRMLRQIVADNPQNADAWMWLGGTAPDAHEQRAALERAIEIAPHNQRARRGLEWLRETRPEAFAPPSEDTAATQPVADQTTTTAEATEAPETTADESTTRPADREAPSVDRDVEPVPVAERTTINEDVTQPMPARDTARQEATAASPTDQTEHMPAPSEPRARPLFAHTDEQETAEMRLPPPAAAPAYEHAPGANIARWLLVIIWSLVLGGMLASAAIFIVSDPALLQQTIQNSLAQVGMPQLVPDNIAALRLVVIGVLVAVALIALWLIIGLILRRRWAWLVNLLVAILGTIGAAALFVPYFTQPASATGGLNFNNPVVQAISGLLGFALIFLLLSLASRRAFHRQPAEEAYGWE